MSQHLRNRKGDTPGRILLLNSLRVTARSNWRESRCVDERESVRCASLESKSEIPTKMTDRITRSAILVVAACLGTTVAGPAHGQLTPALNNKVETVTTLPALGNTENIGQGPDGSIYITGMADRILWKVSPNGHVENFFSVPSLAAFLGVATNKNEIVLGVFQRPFRRPAPAGSQGGAPTIDMSNVGSQILVLDKAGKLVSLKLAIMSSVVLWSFS